MKPDILEVQPQELKFTFELKKQSSCSVQLINKTTDHVAFKIKTTNPKKYCVRPNTGVINPNALCDFIVTMQAPKVAPLDMICKDKFLVQSTIVPEGTKEEHVTSNMFAKEDGKIVDEKRLRVIFVSPPDSSESSPINDPSNLVHDLESRELKEDIIRSYPKIDGSVEVSKGDSERIEATRNDQTLKKNETVKRNEEPLKQSQEYVKRNEEPLKQSQDYVKRNEEPLKQSQEYVKRNEGPLKQSQEYVKRNEELMQVNDTEEIILAKDVEEMKLKVKELESKLTEAKATILCLMEEKRLATQEKYMLQRDLDLQTSKRHRDQTGFPLLFVFMVSLVSLYLGYLLHS